MLSVVLHAKTELEYTPDFLGSPVPLEQLGDASQLNYVEKVNEYGRSYTLKGIRKAGGLTIVNSQEFKERFAHVDSPTGMLPMIDTPSGNYFLGFSAGVLPGLDPIIGKAKTETVLAGLLKSGSLNGMIKIDGRVYGLPITWLPNKRSIATLLENCGINDLSQVLMPQEAEAIDNMGGTTDNDATRIASTGGLAYSTAYPTWGYMNYPQFDMDFVFRPRILAPFCVGPMAREAIALSCRVTEEANCKLPSWSRLTPAIRTANDQVGVLVGYNRGHIAPKNGLSTFDGGKRWDRMPHNYLEILAPLVTGEPYDSQYDSTFNNKSVADYAYNKIHSDFSKINEPVDQLLALVDDSRAHAVKVYAGAKRYAAWLKKSSRTTQNFYY